MHTINKYKWYAVHTRSKSEKIAQRYFEKTGIIAYVPTIRKTKQYTRKVKHYDIPLISCYCFVEINPTQRIAVLKNPYVIEFLRIGKEIYPIPEKEINTLKRVTGEINRIEIVQANHYQIGEEVEVASGHLAGIRGFIIEAKGKNNMIIELRHLGFQLRIYIDQTLLRRIKRLAN